MVLTAAVSATAFAQTTAGVIPGVEVLLTDSMQLIRGKRVGLLTNHSGRDRQGRSTIDLLFKAPGVKLTALYGPEHGIRGIAKAGEKIGSTVDSATGVTVYSLYGDVQIPTPEMLKDIDVLVYDIQDVGARVYTYEWTLAITANAAKKPIIVLDRPDPIRAVAGSACNCCNAFTFTSPRCNAAIPSAAARAAASVVIVGMRAVTAARRMAFSSK